MCDQSARKRGGRGGRQSKRAPTTSPRHLLLLHGSDAQRDDEWHYMCSRHADLLGRLLEHHSAWTTCHCVHHWARASPCGQAQTRDSRTSSTARSVSDVRNRTNNAGKTPVARGAWEASAMSSVRRFYVLYPEGCLEHHPRALLYFLAVITSPPQASVRT
jgi:hypothetical protein